MSQKVTVTVKEGKIRGFKTKTEYSGVEYYSFLGVPYGQSTKGSARFKDPVPVKSWNNTLDCTVPKGGCIQFSVFRGQKIIGSEDCLYNNIHTTELPSHENPLKAVIVLIHGGSLYHGTPDPSNCGAPDYIMHRDIVYVCVGYRISMLGFLNLHMKNCSGNQALKDILLSLRWIKENIHVFGGDPENITLLGSSSGALLLHYILLWPLANGLYHKAIFGGMYAFNPVVVIPTEHVSLAEKFASKIGYFEQPSNRKKLLNFYKKVDFKIVIAGRVDNVYTEKDKFQPYLISAFCCTPEPGENSPIPMSPAECIPLTNCVPILIGFCEKEACIGLTNSSFDLKNDFHKIIQQNQFGWGASLNKNQLQLVQEEVERFYLGGKPIETVSPSVLCDIITDAGLSDVYDSLINVISMNLPSSVFVYNFFYDGKLCELKKVISQKFEKPLKGAFHSADLSYWVYGQELAGEKMENIEPKDRKIIDTITNLFTTFAKTSDPNYEGIDVHWKPTTPDRPSHLIIDETLQVKDELLNGDRMEFWHKLKKKFKTDI